MPNQNINYYGPTERCSISNYCVISGRWQNTGSSEMDRYV